MLFSPGCSTYVRTIDAALSGASMPPQRPAPRTDAVPSLAPLRELDRQAAFVAAAQPHLRFPARIGLARIEGGRISTVPAAEWEAWRALRDALGPGIVDLAPVSPVVAQSILQGPHPATGYGALASLRLAAARQQLDAILVYELNVDTQRNDTEFSVLDATLVGALVRTQRSHASAQASAALIDVRSGLSYGSAVGNGTDTRSAAFLGSEDRLYQQRSDVATKAVLALTPEVEALMQRLVASPPQASPAFVDPAIPAPVADAPARAVPAPSDDGTRFWGRS